MVSPQAAANPDQPAEEPEAAHLSPGRPAPGARRSAPAARAGEAGGVVGLDEDAAERRLALRRHEAARASCR